MHDRDSLGIEDRVHIMVDISDDTKIVPCLSGCHPQPLAVVFGHAHGHSPAWQSSVPTIAPRVPATFSRRRGLRRLPGEGSLERRVCLPPLSAEEYLPIIHLVFANLKTWLNGIHHGVSHQHLQAYLNEFTFRFNKRFYPFNAFRSLLGIAGDVTAPYLRRALLRSLAAAIAPGAVIADVARRHNLAPQHLSNWIRAARDGRFALPADEMPTFVPPKHLKSC